MLSIRRVSGEAGRRSRLDVAIDHLADVQPSGKVQKGTRHRRQRITVGCDQANHVRRLGLDQRDRAQACGLSEQEEGVGTTLDQ
jgi:hypothetical protein